jgi:hypothetical protein
MMRRRFRLLSFGLYSTDTEIHTVHFDAAPAQALQLRI